MLETRMPEGIEAARVTPFLPDAMGVHSEDGTIWLPRSLYPKRADAMSMVAEHSGALFIQVRARARWMRYSPRATVEWWVECAKYEPGAFPVWRCEAA
jgi:hypothetical protein